MLILVSDAIDSLKASAFGSANTFASPRSCISALENYDRFIIKRFVRETKN